MLSPVGCQQIAQGPGQRGKLAVFEVVQRLAEHALKVDRRTYAVNLQRSGSATRTEILGHNRAAAAGAIADVSNSFIAVLLIHFRLVVLMTVVAGVISQRVGMASGATRGSPAVINGETVRLIEGRRAPGTRVVA